MKSYLSRSLSDKKGGEKIGINDDLCVNLNSVAYSRDLHMIDVNQTSRYC